MRLIRDSLSKIRFVKFWVRLSFRPTHSFGLEHQGNEAAVRSANKTRIQQFSVSIHLHVFEFRMERIVPLLNNPDNKECRGLLSGL